MEGCARGAGFTLLGFFFLGFVFFCLFGLFWLALVGGCQRTTSFLLPAKDWKAAVGWVGKLELSFNVAFPFS